MTDTSKRIDVNGTTLFQIGYESLVPADSKVYGLQKGTTGKMAAKLVEVAASADLSDYAKTADLPEESELMTGTATEIADLDASDDLAAVITKVNALLAELRARGVLASSEE